MEKLRALEEEIELHYFNNEYDINKIQKLLKLLDISRLSDSSDIISMIKPYLDNPAKYEGHQEYTGFYPKKPNYERANAELQKIKIRNLAAPEIKELTKLISELSYVIKKIEKTNVKPNVKPNNNSFKLIVEMIGVRINDIISIINSFSIESIMANNLRNISNQINAMRGMLYGSSLDVLNLLKQIEQKALEVLQLL